MSSSATSDEDDPDSDVPGVDPLTENLISSDLENESVRGVVQYVSM